MEKKVEEYHGITYFRPQVTLMNESGIGVSEIAARTCYDSYGSSEHQSIREFDPTDLDIFQRDDILNIDSSDLLDKLAWVHFHHSILEHINLSYFIKGTSRGVLQEHARHRIQAISVRSTRYTMGDLINAFLAFRKFWPNEREWFFKKLTNFDMFITENLGYNLMQMNDILDKLEYQYSLLGDEAFIKLTVHPKSIDEFKNSTTKDEAFAVLQKRKVRNVGNAFKHLVNDNWKVDMVITFNLRSLKNYFDLRDSLAAWFQIQWLAQEMKACTPEKYLALIDKEYKHV